MTNIWYSICCRVTAAVWWIFHTCFYAELIRTFKIEFKQKRIKLTFPISNHTFEPFFLVVFHLFRVIELFSTEIAEDLKNQDRIEKISRYVTINYYNFIIFITEGKKEHGAIIWNKFVFSKDSFSRKLNSNIALNKRASPGYVMNLIYRYKNYLFKRCKKFT